MVLVRRGECCNCGGCCDRSVTNPRWPELRAWIAKQHDWNPEEISPICPFHEGVIDGKPHPESYCKIHEQEGTYQDNCRRFPWKPEQVKWMRDHGFPCSYEFVEVLDPPSEMEVMGP